MHDEPSRKNDRAIEVVSAGCQPSEVIDFCRHVVRPKHFLAAIDRPEVDDKLLTSTYKSVGYRLLNREPLMVLDLSSPLPDTRAKYQTEPVTTLETSAWLQKATKCHHLKPADLLPESRLRMVVAREGDTWIGHAKATRVGTCCWISDVLVSPEYRNRGYGLSLLLELLGQQQQLGASHAVLLASNLGSKLYPKAGFQTVGTLRLYQAPKAVD